MANDEIVRGFDQDKDDSIKITLTRLPDVKEGLCLTLVGYLDTYNSNSFQKRVDKAIEAGYKRLIFVCHDLNYVSSTGIGSFTAFLKKLKSAGGDMVLVGVQPKVFEVFQLLGFSQFFVLRDSVSVASTYLCGGHAVPGNTSSVFPKVFACPICSQKLKALKAGRFRCSGCKTILRIDDNGQVFLG